MAILNVPRTAQEIVQKLCVIIMSHEIHEPFLNVKSAENVVEVCGTNGLCSQPVSGNDQPHVCSCDSGTWWTTGGDFGESRDPCKPVLENWLIIVIGILGFLLLILIIIGKSI